MKTKAAQIFSDEKDDAKQCRDDVPGQVKGRAIANIGLQKRAHQNGRDQSTTEKWNQQSDSNDAIGEQKHNIQCRRSVYPILGIYQSLKLLSWAEVFLMIDSDE